ncbi:MAG TPA: hypothetical protein VNJ53_11015 [Gaiellaceae bacterium]|nr:hypothetical protein [Gaiellaceae bacterium]
MRLLAAGLLALALVPTAALAKSRLVLEETVQPGRSATVTVTTQRRASFAVVLRVPTQGRARLYLTGRSVPRGGPLMDTKTYACEGAAGSFYCRGAYEPLPRGTYTWRVAWAGRAPAHVVLTVRW